MEHFWTQVAHGMVTFFSNHVNRKLSASTDGVFNDEHETHYINIIHTHTDDA